MKNLEKIRGEKYIDLDEWAQKVWRYQAFNILYLHYKQLKMEEMYFGTLRDLCETVLDEYEQNEEYEVCQGIRDMIYEYSAKLDQR